MPQMTSDQKKLEKEYQEFRKKTAGLRMKVSMGSMFMDPLIRGELAGMVPGPMSELATGGLGGLWYGGRKGLSTSSRLRQAAIERQYKKDLGVTGKVNTAFDAMSMIGRLMRIPTALSLLGGFGYKTIGSSPFSMLSKGLNKALGGETLKLGGQKAGSMLSGVLGGVGEKLLPELFGGILGGLPSMGILGGLRMATGIVKAKKLARITASRKPAQQEERKWMLSKNMDPWIKRAVQDGQLQLGDQLQIQLLRWIEGHTSVLPVIHTEMDLQRQEKEKTIDPAMKSLSKATEGGKRSFSDVIMGGMSQALATYDPFTQLSNFIFGGGKSPTAFKKELKEMYGGTKTSEDHDKAWKAGFGLAVEHYGTVTKKGTDIIKAGSSFEAKQMAILVGQYELQRVMAMELTTIRHGGFGLDNPLMAKEQKGIFKVIAEKIKDVTFAIPGISALASIALLPTLPFQAAKRLSKGISTGLSRYKEAKAGGAGTFAALGAFMSKKRRLQSKDYQTGAFEYMSSGLPMDMQRQLALLNVMGNILVSVDEHADVTATHTAKIALSTDFFKALSEHQLGLQFDAAHLLESIRYAVAGPTAPLKEITSIGSLPFSSLATLTDLQNTLVSPLGNLDFATSGSTNRLLIGATQMRAGGSIAAGDVAVVGEEGPEIFVPNRAGGIIPTGVSRRLFGGTFKSGRRTLGQELGEVEQAKKEKEAKDWRKDVINLLKGIREKKFEVKTSEREKKEKSLFGKVLDLIGGWPALAAGLGVAATAWGIKKIVDWLGGEDTKAISNKAKEALGEYFKGEGFWSAFPAFARWGSAGALVGSVFGPMGALGGGLIIGSIGSFIEDFTAAKEKGGWASGLKRFFAGPETDEYSFWRELGVIGKYGVIGAGIGWIAGGPPGAIAGGILSAGVGLLIRDLVVGYEKSDGDWGKAISSLLTGDGKGGLWNAVKGATKLATIGGGIGALAGLVGGPVGIIGGALIGMGLGAALGGFVSGFGEEGLAELGEKFWKYFTGPDAELAKSFYKWNAFAGDAVKILHDSYPNEMTKFSALPLTLLAGIVGGAVGSLLKLVAESDIAGGVLKALLPNSILDKLGVKREKTTEERKTEVERKITESGKGVSPTEIASANVKKLQAFKMTGYDKSLVENLKNTSQEMMKAKLKDDEVCLPLLSSVNSELEFRDLLEYLNSSGITCSDSVLKRARQEMLIRAGLFSTTGGVDASKIKAMREQGRGYFEKRYETIDGGKKLASSALSGAFKAINPFYGAYSAYKSLTGTETGGTAPPGSIKTPPPKGSLGAGTGATQKSDTLVDYKKTSSQRDLGNMSSYTPTSSTSKNSLLGSTFDTFLNTLVSPSDVEDKDPTEGGDMGHNVDAEAAAASTDAKAVGAGLETLIWGKNVDRRVDRRLLKIWANIQYEAGYGPITITSGYRSPEYNKKVGGAKKSLHMKGLAIDIACGHLSKEKRLRLIRIASKHGIGGIGIYNSSMHFDLGRRRAWGPCYSSTCVPSWAAKAIQEHLGNKFGASIGKSAEVSPTSVAGGAAGDISGGGATASAGTIRQLLESSQKGEFFPALFKNILSGGFEANATETGTDGGTTTLAPLSAEEKAAWGDKGYGKVGPIKKLIIETAQKKGVDPRTALAIAFSESGFNPSARAKCSSCTARGLYQIIRKTARGIGADWNKLDDPQYSADFGIGMLADDTAQIKKAGFNVSPGSVYLLHFLGTGGGLMTLRGNNEYMSHFKQMGYSGGDPAMAVPLLNKRLMKKYAASMNVMADWGGVNIKGLPMQIKSNVKEAFLPLENRVAMKSIGRSLITGLTEALKDPGRFVAGKIQHYSIEKVGQLREKAERRADDWKEKVVNMLPSWLKKRKQDPKLPPNWDNVMKRGAAIKTDPEPGQNVKILDNSSEQLIATLFRSSSTALLKDMKQYALDSNFIHNL